MKLILRAAVAAVAFIAAPFAFAAHTHMPANSTWTLNVGESNFGGGFSMKSDTFVITTDTDKWAKWSDNMVDGDGKNWKSSWSGPEDGHAHPFTGMSGNFSTNPATDVSAMTFPDGTVQTCHFWLNSAKNKYSEKCVAKSPDGKEVNQTLVYDRVK
ncbi:MAG TPA: hypothetical protein VMD97_03755 [Candidatus Aquilonibacter sp.]|nr:hypothetical protein [Candidatus Aquilonibacter sp.]